LGGSELEVETIKEDSVDLSRMIQIIKEHPDYPKIGMIASHLGVVRGTSLNGKRVKGIDVRFDKNSVQKIISDIKEMTGIVQVLVETSGGRLKVGEEVMAVVVAGDTRDHVFPALMNAVNRLKAEAATKKEIL
jgi:molybdopterin synthase catalytic subunit